MAGKKLEQAKAALEILINAGHEDNDIFYMEFGSKPGDIVELTGTGRRLPPMIGQAKSHRTGTALYDAIAVALCRLRAAHNRRQALLVITDGADQHSRIPIGDLIRIVQSSQAQVFMVGYFSAEESMRLLPR